MKNIRVIAAFIAAATVLPACNTIQAGAGPAPAASGQARVAAATVPQKFTALGYGAMNGNFAQYTQGQQKLMAMRAARLDAYRALADQVYGFRILGNTAVAAFSTQNDNVRSYVEAFIRGARVVSMTPIADGNYEATVELELTPDFIACVANAAAPAACGVPAAPAPMVEASCMAAGCVQSSSYYYTTP